MFDRRFITDVVLSTHIGRESYLNTLPVIAHLQKHKSLPITSDITFFVGENGTGKSTLLEAIAVASGFNAESGTKNFYYATNNTHSKLHEHITLAKSKYPKDGFFLRAESFYNAATYIDEVGAAGSYGGKSLHSQSHGESFMSLVQNRFRSDSLFLLDEPEAALSPLKLMTLMVEISSLIKQNCQFIIATHSPILMTFPNALIYEFSENGIVSVDYRQTEHYRITRGYLENPERMLKYLLEE